MVIAKTSSGLCDCLGLRKLRVIVLESKIYDRKLEKAPESSKKLREAAEKQQISIMYDSGRHRCLLVLAITCLVTLTSARPQHANLAANFDPSAQIDNTVDSNDYRRFYQNAEDPTLAGLQMQLLAQQYAVANRLEGMPWEQMLRAPETKRQVRYRQCYFNPISCFRK